MRTRTMYWAQIDEGGSSVMRGGMDGSWMETVEKGGEQKGLAIDADSRLYWWNPTRERFEYYNPEHRGRGSFQLSKYNSFAVQRITINGNSLYWAGLPKGSSGSSETIFKANLNREGELEDQDGIEKYVVREFKNVTGLWVCDADFEKKKRAQTCAHGRQCAGLCLSNGTASFRCVCPMGFESHGANGSSCKG